MGGEHAPLILIELVLVFGSVLLFAWWQLRSVERDRQESQRRREAEAAREAAAADEAAGPPVHVPSPTEEHPNDHAR